MFFLYHVITACSLPSPSQSRLFEICLPSISTEWSKKTVKSNLFLTGPKISKSAITQWFLGSLYRAVLVFWCFKSVKCVEFCLSKLCYTIQGLKHSYTPLDAFKPHKHTYTPLLCSQKHPPVISGQFRTTRDTNRHQVRPTDTNRPPKRLFEDVWPFRLTSNGVLWCLLVSDGLCECLMLSRDVGRVSEEFLRGYLSAFYGRV